MEGKKIENRKTEIMTLKEQKPRHPQIKRQNSKRQPSRQVRPGIDREVAEIETLEFKERCGRESEQKDLIRSAFAASTDGGFDDIFAEIEPCELKGN